MKELVKNTFEALSKKPSNISEVELGSMEVANHHGSGSSNRQLIIEESGPSLEEHLEAEKAKMLKEVERTFVEVHGIMQ